MRTKLVGIIVIVAALSGVVAGSLVYSHAIPGVTTGPRGHKVWHFRFMDVSAWQSQQTELTTTVTITVNNATFIGCWVSGRPCGLQYVTDNGFIIPETYTQKNSLSPVPNQIQIEVDTGSSGSSVMDYEYVNVEVA